MNKLWKPFSLCCSVQWNVSVCFIIRGKPFWSYDIFSCLIKVMRRFQEINWEMFKRCFSGKKVLTQHWWYSIRYDKNYVDSIHRTAFVRYVTIFHLRYFYLLSSHRVKKCYFIQSIFCVRFSHIIKFCLKVFFHLLMLNLYKNNFMVV